MVRLSTVVILLGIGLVIAPLPPPIGIVLGAIGIVVGLFLRFMDL